MSETAAMIFTLEILALYIISLFSLWVGEQSIKFCIPYAQAS